MEFKMQFALFYGLCLNADCIFTEETMFCSQSLKMGAPDYLIKSIVGSLEQNNVLAAVF